jgi:hypothetical protein
VTRRQVIKIGATTAVSSVTTFLGSPPAFAAAPLRKNIDSLSTGELDNYKHAVKILKDRSAANPAAKDGYVWQAALHNDFDRIRPDGEPGGCEHRSERFFPWNRRNTSKFRVTESLCSRLAESNFRYTHLRASLSICQL